MNHGDNRSTPRRTDAGEPHRKLVADFPSGILLSVQAPVEAEELEQRPRRHAQPDNS
jgi:hypothetical protein